MDFLKDLNLDKVRNLAEDAFNQAKPKTDLEAKVYEVLSHKNWGSSSTLMNEVASDTFDYDKFAVISQLMWEAMENQRPAAWRVVFKGLTLLEHLIKNGSERCVDDARGHGHILRALQQFNYYEGTIDRGLGVREKTKQIIEILGDDERIREERGKARKLRQKFGGNLGGAGSGASGGGGGGRRGGGYGNDNWNSGGGSGGGGYGEGGIGSGRNDDRGARGRYDTDDSGVAASSTPTFASMPEELPKKSKMKKKKKREEAASAPAPEVDLFSFDDPTPAAAPAAADDDFGDFAGAGGSGATSQQPAAVDPFATAPPQQQQQQQFDAFGGGSNNSQTSFGGFASAPQQQQQQPAMGFANSNMNGGGMMQQQQQPPTMGGNGVMGAGNGMSGGMNSFQSPPQQQGGDDDFGDFADAAPSQAAKRSSDPLSNLISLDGLSKNSNKNEDKLNAPIIANAAAAVFVQEKEQIHANVQQSKKGSTMSFAGLDGLNSNSSGMMSMGGGMPSQMNSMMPPAASMGMNPGVMGGGGATASAIGMLDPSTMSNFGQTQSAVPQQQQQQQQQQQHFQQQQAQAQGMNPNMQQQGFGGMQGGMMPGGMQQQGFNNIQGAMQSGMPNQQSMGMMQMNPGMNGMQAQGGMNNFNGMQPNMGQQQNGNQMGGFR